MIFLREKYLSHLTGENRRRMRWGDSMKKQRERCCSCSSDKNSGIPDRVQREQGMNEHRQGQRFFSLYPSSSKKRVLTAHPLRIQMGDTNAEGVI